MSNNKTLNLFLAICMIGLLSNCENKTVESKVEYPYKLAKLEPAAAKKIAESIERETPIEVAEGLKVTLWASDSLVKDPVAMSMAPNGAIYFTRGSRLEHSEFDIRGHRDWMPASISFQTVEDRRNFLRKTFADENEDSKKFLTDLNKDGTLDWKDLTVEKEQIWVVEDSDGDQLADRSQLYIEDFHEEITDLANGLEFHNGEVFLCVGPDLWRIRDTNGDGIADEKESISHGFGVHIGFGAHGMSGAKIGPDGRIWWGIGDIGMNVVDKEGKHWKYPNRGVIVRSELDGSNFEVYAHGVRNTHEFVFDNYGNLISEDNDGDHQGERERLVYLINGSDSGWRINWQFGKYTDPDNNSYKVWMDEKMSIPRWDGQAAYFLPPIINYVNGPTGMVHNPGTALGKKWENHFFIAEFRGSVANSPVHAFTLKPKGASFELDQTVAVAKGVLPTGLDFGPDGALYIGDWVDGWNTNGQGRIWRLDVDEVDNSEMRKEIKKLMMADFSKNSESELGQWLKHDDKRIRQKAQFELVKRADKGLEILLATAKDKSHQLARIHSLWGIAQIARTQDKEKADLLIPFLQDEDPEMICQASKMLGDIKYKSAADKIIPILNHESLRLQLHAAEALGRMEHKAALQPICDMLEKNNGEDSWLRHAGMIALGRIGEDAPLAALKDHESRALRIAAVVALRRMNSPKVAEFLNDKDEYIVAEAARAINDDFSIEAALPQLADVLKDPRFTNEALLRRVINANLRVGKDENIKNLVDYINLNSAPADMRAEALGALSTWSKTSVFDRVDGRYRGSVEREASPVLAAIAPMLNDLLADKNASVQIAALNAMGRLDIKDKASDLLALFKSSKDGQVRQSTLMAMNKTKANNLSEALELGLSDSEQSVRATALQILPESDIAKEATVKLFEQVLSGGSVVEKQSAISALGKLQSDEANVVLNSLLDQLSQGTLEEAVQLDVIVAVEKSENDDLNKKLASYQDQKSKDDGLAMYREALSGGDVRRGRNIFYRHEAAQCVRCHAVFEYGGNAGPVLSGVADRISSEKMLESMILPSATLAAGYGVAMVKMENDEVLSGIVVDENEKVIKLRVGKGEIKEVDKSGIKSRTDIPSSMPSVEGILDKMQIRDLISFLGSLEEREES